MTRNIESSTAYFTEEELVQLGWVEEPRQSSHFEKFGLLKPSGKIRIGIFGESYVAGYEVGVNSDFPSLLQKILNRIAPDKYEVLNFGSGSYGFTQAHLLYKSVEKRFDLDVIVFLTLNINAIRDQNLVYPQSPGTFPIKGPVHSRYYLENDQVKQIKIIGRNRIEANQLYNSFFFPLSYFRYTFFLPPFLSSLLPYQKDYRTNPFYYDQRFSPQESYTIYEKVFSQMSRESQNKKILVVTNIDELLKPTNLQTNLFFTKFDPFKLNRQNELLYTAPCCHQSPLGNFELAKHTLLSLVDNHILARPLNTNLEIWKTKFLSVNLEQTIEECSYSKSGIRELLIVSNSGTPILKPFEVKYGEPEDPNLVAGLDKKIDFQIVFKEKNLIIFGLKSFKRLLLIPVEKQIKIDPSKMLRLRDDFGNIGFFKLIPLAESVFFLQPVKDSPQFDQNQNQTSGLIDHQDLEDIFGVRRISSAQQSVQNDLQLKIKSKSEVYVFRSVYEYDELLTDKLDLSELFLRIKSENKEISCKLFDVVKSDLSF